MRVEEAVTFARNSEVLQNDLSENYDPIGHWKLASGGVMALLESSVESW